MLETTNTFPRFSLCQHWATKTGIEQQKQASEDKRLSPTLTITASKQPNNYHFPTSKSFTNTSIKHQHKRQSCQHLVHVRQQQRRNDVNNRTTTTTLWASPSPTQASNTKTNIDLADISYMFDNNNNATTQTTEQLPLPYKQVLHKDKHQTPRRTSISSTSRKC